MFQQAVVIIAAMVFSPILALGQNSGTSYKPYPSSSVNSSHVTNGDVSLSNGKSGKMPPNYDKYYYQNNNYPLSPYISPAAGAGQRRLVLGNVQAYSDEEYGRLLLSAMKGRIEQPAGAKTTTATIVREDNGESDGSTRFSTVETKILDTLDRGVFLVDTGEELKLRGVRMPSEKSSDDIVRFYAREAIKELRDLARNQTVYVVLDDPIRDNDGTLLGVIYLKDGTQINRLMIQAGYGTLDKADFAPDSDLGGLAEAETAARKSKVGVWSTR